MKRYKPYLLTLAWSVSALIFPWLVMGPAGFTLERLWAWGAAHLPVAIQRWLQPGWMHIFVFAAIAIPGGLLLKAAWPPLSRGMAWLLTSLGYGLAYKAATFFPDISTYPFSLAWSEASRYYYASLYLGQQIYGLHVPLSILHPSRYLLQAIPFLIPDSSLWLHRAWQVLLWLGTSGLTGWLLARRAARGQPRAVRLAMGMGVILFLFQGPVYYHLLVMVLLGLWGFNPQRPWRTLAGVALASVWAGISRVNWLPVPGLLAATLYLLEVPFQQEGSTNKSGGTQADTRQGKYEFGLRGLVHYLLPPAAWTVIGTLLAWGSQQAYQALSGNPTAYFGSSFSSDLLWYRLLPNPTYPLGILPSALLVSLPVLSLMGIQILPTWRSYHPLRLLGLGAILGVLFVGGVVVSVKIGGGSNLHNLDAYLVLLLVIGSFGLFNFAADREKKHPAKDLRGDKPTTRSYPWLVGLAAAVPLLFAISAGGPWPQRDHSAAQADLETLRLAAQQAVINGGEVLFVNQRHLLTFGEIPNVPLMADYELVFLMEMAMAGNQAYLDAFHVDLQNHRFDLIIAEPLTVQYQGRARSFGEENDAWVTQVSAPILCYYQPLASLEIAGVVLYVPSQPTCP